MSSNSDKKHFVYILLTEKGHYYCGYATDVEKRFQKHISGKGAKYTRSDKPVKIVYKKELPTKSEALKREYKIKQLSHDEKKNLINHPYTKKF